MSKTNFAMFLAGATVGSATTWLLLKKRYERIAQEEIDSVKAVFARRDAVNNNDTPTETHEEDIAKLKPDFVDYAAKLQEEGYIDYAEHGRKNTEKKKEKVTSAKPYIISPDEFGTSDDYTQISLVYYDGDEVLADEEDEVVEDIAGTVGEDFAEHFGEYEDDSVFVRNDILRCDYEICKDNRSFADVTDDSTY